METQVYLIFEKLQLNGNISAELNEVVKVALRTDAAYGKAFRLKKTSSSRFLLEHNKSYILSLLFANKMTRSANRIKIVYYSKLKQGIQRF